MPFYLSASILLATLGVAIFTSAAPSASDPCAKIAGKTFMVPADALACQRSFPFNETLRQNILTVISRVFDFYTFEDYYLNSPPPFQESTIDIRGELARINATKYETIYDFNKDVYDFTTQLNDGHTRWFWDCISSFQNILPAPVVSLEENGSQGVFIAPDSTEFVSLLGSEFTDYYASIGFNWQRLAGAKVLQIEGQDPYDYVDFIARTVSGNYLDHGVRVNSVFSSYRISGTDFSQRLGDLAGPTGADQNDLSFVLIPVNSTEAETVTVPYLTSFSGASFTDSASFWQNNCAANNATNGVDLKSSSQRAEIVRSRKQPRASIIDKSTNSAVGLPQQFQPTLRPVNGSTGVIKSYILPGNTTGVMFIGSFEGDYNQFQTDTVAAIDQFKASGVTHLLIDLTNNGGGYVCLGQFLHQYLAGSNFGYPGFVSSTRGNTLARKIVASEIALGLDDSIVFYSADNWAFLNNSQMPKTFDYLNPTFPFIVNDRYDPTSQPFLDTCGSSFAVPIPESPPFHLNNVAIVTNGNCASTCAMFSTLMNERHGTSIAVFGGKPGQEIQYKGMAGNQVLEWTDIDAEIKTANLKNDPLAPPDLLVSGNFRHNWRTAWSFFNEFEPIAYVSELPRFRFAYTQDTYNNPQNLWTFAESQLFS